MTHVAATAAVMPPSLAAPRHDWTREEVRALFALPFPDLMFRAQRVHRQNFDPARGADLDAAVDQDRRLPGRLRLLPAERAQYDTGVKAEKLMALDAVLAEARAAKAAGAARFCMGAAWRSPKDRDLDKVCAMVEGVKALGLETCATLGMLDAAAGARLKATPASTTTTTTSTPRRNITARSSPRAPIRTGSTRSAHVRDAGINVCCGGIVGMGESAEDRVGMIATLATLPAASGKRADQYAGAGRRHAARERRGSSIRSISCAPSRSRASPCRPRWCGSRPAART